MRFVLFAFGISVSMVACAGASDAVPCAGCFAVMVIPDTQHHTEREKQPHGGDVLRAVGRYACEHRTEWTEPGTDQTMPILMVLHLGDLVQNAWKEAGRPGGVAEGQWSVIDSAFDELDVCKPVVPYLVVLGNHDGDRPGVRNATHSQQTDGFNRWFAPPCMDDGSSLCPREPHPPRPAWREGRCSDPPACAYPSEWYLGNGDDIAANSRLPGTALEGPSRIQPGRHRAGVIRTPAGGQLLFIGLDFGLDWGLDAPHGDDLAWVEGLMDRFPGAPTVLVHHEMGANGVGGYGTLMSSRGAQALRAAWERLVVARPQVRLTLNGHWIPGRPARRAQNIARTVGEPGRIVHSLFRNYQSNQDFGWTVFLAFDPAAGELRVRSHQIAPTEEGPRIVKSDLRCSVDAPDEHCPTTLAFPWPADRASK